MTKESKSESAIRSLPLSAGGNLDAFLKELVYASAGARPILRKVPVHS